MYISVSKVYTFLRNAIQRWLRLRREPGSAAAPCATPPSEARSSPSPPAEVGTYRWTLPRLQRALAEDADGLARSLFEHYYSRLIGFFLRRGVRRDDCDDLAQEAIFRIINRVNNFRGESTFDSWVFKIALNELREHRRRFSAQKRAGKEVSIDGSRDEVEDRPGWKGDRTPEREALRREQVGRLHDEVQRLPPRMRQCMRLWMAEWSYQEIADELNISLATVKAHLAQGRAKLKRRLGG
ncbi:MAG: sigma-70 family RNA polymerase sigma factor [Acidobacteriota bacterium]